MITQEDKNLLLIDLCARLPYGVKAQVTGWDEEKGEVEVPLKIYSINTDGYVYFETNDYDVNYIPIEVCRLYLRPISSMTKKEKEELRQEHIKDEQLFADCIKNHPEMRGLIIPHFAADWCDKNMFDYRGLISKGLAIAVTVENNPYEN